MAELLAPAGDIEKLKTALHFGADAVYAGGGFSLRADKSMDGDMAEGIRLAHEAGKKLYAAVNIYARDDDFPAIADYIKMLDASGADGIIAADPGIISLARKCAPNLHVHVSTQANTTNSYAAAFWADMGVKRIVAAREMSIENIKRMRDMLPGDVEIESFVHGAMCISYSGRCLLSDYLTGRGSNRGDCAQPCRWKYALVEEKRPGQYMEIETAGEGSYILNSRDMCMIEHIPELVNAGVTSLKIEGRAKSAYYVSVITHAYRQAVDWCFDHPGEPFPAWIVRETEAISHRPYSTGFYFGSEPGQETVHGGYVRDCEVIAVCDGRQGSDLLLTQKNRFFRGDVADVLEPGRRPYEVSLDAIFNEDGEPLESAPHPAMRVRLRSDAPVSPGAILRKWSPSEGKTE